MPRLMRAAATASMVSSARMNRAVRKSIQQPATSQPAAAPVAAPEAPAAAANSAMDDLTQQLKQLDSLRQQGILTEEEFAAKKAKLLGI